MDSCSSQDEIRVKLLVAACSEDVLVAAAKLGDRVAFEELWRRHSHIAFKRVCQITRNHADAEDVIQEAWMRAYVHLNSFDGRSKFSTWLTRIAVNSALMMARRKRSRPEACMEFTDGETWTQRESEDETKDIEWHYIRHQNIQRLRRAIRHLTPNLRTVVEIHHWSDGTIKEVAASAGISLTAAKSRLSRARTILRRALT